MKLWFLPALLFPALLASHSVDAGDDAAKPSIEASARALLSRCVVCHRGEDAAGGLDLSRRDLAIQGGESGPALVPGHSKKSPLFLRVAAKKMPPKEPFSAEDIATLEKWVAAGAPWTGEVVADPHVLPPTWAFRPLVRPPLPHSDRPTPIDAFLDVRLAERHVVPNGPAVPRDLVRRLSFDLIGLPPTIEQVTAFSADPSSKAYSELVDRLLASPQYGERWAKHWLDVARFGESHGFEYDRLRETAWPYRDYVIKSLNADKPYAEFVRDQLIGDVRSDATSDTIAATGFLVAGPYDEANAAQASLLMRARSREEELEDTVAVVAQSFLGLTVNCARCHDHKFDPIKQEDYYRLASAFAGVKHGERPALGVSDLKLRDAKLASWKAEIETADRQVSRLDQVASERLAGRGTIAAVGPQPTLRWSFDSGPDSDIGGLRGRLQGGATISAGALHLSGGRAFLEAGPLPSALQSKTLEAWARIENSAQGGGSILTVQARGAGQFDAIVYGERQPRKWVAGSEGFIRTRDLDAPTEPETPRPLIHMVICYDPDGTIRIYRDGELYGTPTQPEKSPRLYQAEESEILIGLRHTGAGNGYFSGQIDEVRVYDRALSAEDVVSSFRNGPGGVGLDLILKEMTAAERAARETAVRRREEATRSSKTAEPLAKVYAATLGDPGVTHLLLRGDVEKKGKLISAGGLSAARPNPDLGLAPEAPEAERRRRLADWVVDRENPLTYRVMANRLWHYHFGTGLVATPNDLGASGERPSHPELLDWLACELRDNGGSLKALHRMIVKSDAYQRSSQFDASKAEKDAESRLLWRFSPRRLEGEAIRDAMLASSGRLNPAMFGPSFRPFTVTVFGSNIYTLIDPPGPEFERRTIYRMHVLSAKNPLLESLDCPDPGVKMPRRGLTTTPLQALALMNDTFVIRQAKGLAERVKREAGDDLDRQVDRAYRISLTRSPTEIERLRARDLAKSHGLDAVTWALLNCSEFVHVD